MRGAVNVVESDDSNRTDGLPSTLEMDHVFDALYHPHRRYLLYTLQVDGQQPLWAIAKRIAAWEEDVPVDTVSEDAVERVYVSLYHNHIPKLASDGIVSFSEAEETIESGSNAEEVLAVLDQIGGLLDSSQESHAKDEEEKGGGHS